MAIHTVVGYKEHKYIKNGQEKNAVFLFTTYDDPAAVGQPCESNFVNPAIFKASGVGIGDKVQIFKTNGFVNAIYPAKSQN